MPQPNPQGMPHPGPRTGRQDFVGSYPQDTYRPYPTTAQYSPSDVHGYPEPLSAKKPGEERRQPTTHQVPNSQGAYAPSYVPAAPMPNTRAVSPIRAPAYSPEPTLPYTAPGVGGFMRPPYPEDPYAPTYPEPDWRWQAFREFLISEPFEGRKALQYELFDWHMEVSERLGKQEVAAEFLRMLQVSKSHVRAGGGCVLDGGRHPSRPRPRPDLLGSEAGRSVTPLGRNPYAPPYYRDPQMDRQRDLDLEPPYSRTTDYSYGDHGRSDSRPRGAYGHDVYGRADSRPRDTYGGRDSSRSRYPGHSESRLVDNYGRSSSRTRRDYHDDAYVNPDRRAPTPTGRPPYDHVDPRADPRSTRPDDRNMKTDPRAAGAGRRPEMEADGSPDIHNRVPSVTNLRDPNAPDQPPPQTQNKTDASSTAPPREDTGAAPAGAGASTSTGSGGAKLAREVIFALDGVKKVHKLFQLCEGDMVIYTLEEYPDESWRKAWLRIIGSFMIEGSPEIPGYFRGGPGDKICFATLLHTLIPNLQTLPPDRPSAADLKRFVLDHLAVYLNVVNHEMDDIIFVAATRINKAAGETHFREFDVPISTLICVPLTGLIDGKDGAVVDFKHPSIKLEWTLSRTWIVSYKSMTKPALLLTHGAMKDAIFILVGLRRKAGAARVP